MSSDSRSEKASGKFRYLVRKTRKRDAAPGRLIAYDLETTRISRGTPRPLYLTAFSEADAFSFATRLRSIDHLGEVLRDVFLVPRFSGARFVAWNANYYDSYFVAAALVQMKGFVIKPFLTRSKNLRGMMIYRADEMNLHERERARWYFLDGMAMLGFAGLSLEKFLKVFAPDRQKLKDAIDFERESFSADNPLHCEYAMRDSEGLYYGMRKAESILLERFNQSLTVTMGAACIRILSAHIPESVVVVSPPPEAESVIRRYVMRGGYCHCVGRYQGRIWKYDINQAYAAAMRECALPAGRCFHLRHLHRYGQIFIVRVSGFHPTNPVPFYCKIADEKGIPRSVFVTRQITDTWITSIEYQQLLSEGWNLDVHESWTFEGAFRLTEFVDKLERMRMTCEGGPSGPIGTMIKAVGNHSYGKTVEQLDDYDLVLARDCPPGYAQFFPPDDSVPLPLIWYRTQERRERDYHQPQIGAFITAHVRMVIRRAALLAPDSWLYADTDCVAFSRDVTALLDIDPKRYGAFKLEVNGDWYRIIAKKVYASVDGSVKHAKGLNIRHLDASDFEAWYSGQVPMQAQVQRQNFMRVLSGSEMFIERVRRGTAV